MKEEEREVLEAELSSLRHHLREAEAAIAVSERFERWSLSLPRKLD